MVLSPLPAKPAPNFTLAVGAGQGRLPAPVGRVDHLAVGDTLNTVAVAVLVFRMTGSGLGVSGVVIAEILPVLPVAPIVGAMSTICPASALWPSRPWSSSNRRGTALRCFDDPNTMP